MKPALTSLLLSLAAGSRMRVTDMRRLTIAGLIAALFAALTLGTFVPGASAQNPRLDCVKNPNTDPCWPPVKPPVVVSESYTDLPWHQRLGTYAGNQLDEAFVYPYAALVALGRTTYCTTEKITDNARCMIEVGINNILSITRTDTPYDQTDTNSPIRTAKSLSGDFRPDCRVF